MRLLLSVCVLVVLALTARASFAHPAGFASVNRYIGVEYDGQRRLRVAYILDFAELPSVSEVILLDADDDGIVTPAEQHAYLAKRLPPLVAAWAVEVDDDIVSAHIVTSQVNLLAGERGGSNVRIAAEVAIDPPRADRTGDLVVRIRDLTLDEYGGWREIVAADSADAIVISGAKANPATALAYGDGSRSPPRVNDASFTFRRQRSDLPGAGARAPILPRITVDPWLARIATTIRVASGSARFSAIGLLLALALGAAHALSPGHGKTLAAAYLIGGPPRARHAFIFGFTVTAAHTIVVFAIGALALALERTVGSDRLLRSLEIISAFVVLVLGLVQSTRRFRAAVNDEDHSHTLPDDSRSVVALGAASGITPCPSALAILLSAIALHRWAFGLALVLAFSAGVALTLTLVGLVVVFARSFAERAPRMKLLLRWLPLASSSVVLVIGVLLCASALS